MTYPLVPRELTAVQAAFEQLSSGVFVNQGPDHRFVALNAAARAILGTS